MSHIISRATVTTTAARTTCKNIDEYDYFALLLRVVLLIFLSILVFSHFRAPVEQLEDNSALNQWVGYQTIIDSDGDFTSR